ncbi:hypothetical protein C5167_006563 [Papaver somniferum]|uniref:Uncharacterized protein n=1 Tax=Papaver somniferum TaxID=3469 RepID=A0A4Y7JHI7_PAPSO|nr:hypothetical protein C5167_006563 [Papaver somniferum]
MGAVVQKTSGLGWDSFVGFSIALAYQSAGDAYPVTLDTRLTGVLILLCVCLRCKMLVTWICIIVDVVMYHSTWQWVSNIKWTNSPSMKTPPLHIARHSTNVVPVLGILYRINGFRMTSFDFGVKEKQPKNMAKSEKLAR